MNRRAFLLSESRCNVATVTAILTLSLFICTEHFTTCRAFIFGHALPFSFFGVLIPPFIPACIAAEPWDFSSWIYRQRAAAVITPLCLQCLEFIKSRILPKSMPDAVGFDCPDIQACHFCQCFISNTLKAHFSDNCFVFFCHFLTPAFLRLIGNYSLKMEEKSSVVFDTLTRTHFISCASLIPAHEHIITSCANMKPLNMHLRIAKQLHCGYRARFWV